jgi:hypothetical protein
MPGSLQGGQNVFQGNSSERSGTLLEMSRAEPMPGPMDREILMVLPGTEKEMALCLHFPSLLTSDVNVVSVCFDTGMSSF